MTAPVKHIADRHEVELRRHVHGLLRHDRKWWLLDESDTTGPFDGVVVALPAEQAIPFLGMHDLSMARAAVGARTQPCWTTLVVFERSLDIASDLMRDRGLIAWACRNNAKPGRSGPEAWVVQASPAWSATNLDLDPQNVAEIMLDALFSLSRDTERPAATSLSAHCWRYAMTRGTDRGALWNDDLRIGACGDWLLGPRVELAWHSGRMLGERIASSLQSNRH